MIAIEREGIPKHGTKAQFVLLVKELKELRDILFVKNSKRILDSFLSDGVMAYALPAIKALNVEIFENMNLTKLLAPVKEMLESFVFKTICPGSSVFRSKDDVAKL